MCRGPIQLVAVPAVQKPQARGPGPDRYGRATRKVASRVKVERGEERLENTLLGSPRWSVKVPADPNGAGVIASATALNSFSHRADLVLWIKAAGAIYFVGVFAFAYGFYCIHAAVFAFDNMLHATRQRPQRELLTIRNVLT